MIPLLAILGHGPGVPIRQPAKRRGVYPSARGDRKRAARAAAAAAHRTQKAFERGVCRAGGSWRVVELQVHDKFGGSWVDFFRAVQAKGGAA